MIELKKEQDEKWIQFREEASQRTSKGPLHNKEFGTGKNRYEVHFKGFSVYQDRYEDKNETWFDYWIADNLEHLDDQIGEEDIDNKHFLNPKARSLLIETKIDCFLVREENGEIVFPTHEMFTKKIAKQKEKEKKEKKKREKKMERRRRERKRR